MIDDFVYNNEDESDMGQLHSIHVHMNAIAAVRRNISTSPSLENCIDCDNEIPKERRDAAQGCCRCVQCQEIFEFSAK